MKYIAVLALIVFLVRIDFFMGIIDRLYDKASPAPADVKSEDVGSNREVIPVNKDVSLKQNPKLNFLSLMEDFKTAPVAEIRNRAMNVLRENPTMFGIKLDSDLEGQVFGWRELVSSNEPEVANFVLELMAVLQGENQELMKRFFVAWFDTNLPFFIAAYSRTKDANCAIAKTFPYPLSEEDQLNEFYEREEMLIAFLGREKLDPVHKELAQNCKLQVVIEIDKLAPKFVKPAVPPLDPNAVEPTMPTQPTVTPEPAPEAAPSASVEATPGTQPTSAQEPNPIDQLPVPKINTLPAPPPIGGSSP